MSRREETFLLAAVAALMVLATRPRLAGRVAGPILPLDRIDVERDLEHRGRSGPAIAAAPAPPPPPIGSTGSARVAAQPDYRPFRTFATRDR